MLPFNIQRITILSDAEAFFRIMRIANRLYPSLLAIDDDKWHMRGHLKETYGPHDLVLVDDAFAVRMGELQNAANAGATVMTVAVTDRHMDMAFMIEEARERAYA